MRPGLISPRWASQSPKPLDPVVDGQSLGRHPEAVAALFVDVQLDRASGRLPFGIEAIAAGGGQAVVGGAEDKQRRCVVGDLGTGGRSAVDRRREVRPGVRVVIHHDAHRDHAAGRETHDADAVGLDAPFGRVLAHDLDCLAAVGGAE